MNSESDNILKWLQAWYKSECNGDWEHSYGVKITTIDNPGWGIKIDLQETDLENLKINYKLVENSESDWYGYKVKDSRFEAAGDPSKLEFLLEKFKEIVDKYLENVMRN